jgi:hypothetical protein
MREWSGEEKMREWSGEEKMREWSGEEKMREWSGWPIAAHVANSCIGCPTNI